jgi:hypothetical protein
MLYPLVSCRLGATAAGAIKTAAQEAAAAAAAATRDHNEYEQSSTASTYGSV